MQKLSNEVVELVPMNESHIEGLYEAAQYPEIWTHMSVNLKTYEDVIKYVNDGLEKAKKGTDFPFVIIEKRTSHIVGSTSYMDISIVHKRLEIGSTWLTPAVWRSAVNTNCKFLLLQYGFEQFGMNRIQIKTGHENIQSQKAIERLGAVKEGILRNHMIRKEGTIRHTVMYSITNEEWPSIKKRFLQELL
jgi:N-acetyltransferase